MKFGANKGALMDASMLKKQVITDFNAFIEMKAKAASNQKATLNQAAKQFEALFMQNMLKSMRQANQFLSEDNPLNSHQVQTFQEMLDKQSSLNIANGGHGIGLAEMMLKQLDKKNQLFQHQQRSNQLDTAKDISHKKSSWLSHLANRKSMVATPKDFVQAIWPVAKTFAKEIGVDPKMLIAQAVHETGWGKHINKDQKGQPSFNLFNIKGGSSWAKSKPQNMVLTTEYIDGKAIKVKEPFRAYTNFEESFRDYISLIKNSERYQTALSQSENAEKYMHELQQAGYATDPAYAEKVIAIYKGSSLEQMIAEVESK